MYGDRQSVSRVQDHPGQPQLHGADVAGAVEETVVAPQILFTQGYGSAQSLRSVHAHPKQPQVHGVDAALTTSEEVGVAVGVGDAGEALAVFDGEPNVDVRNVDVTSDLAGLVVVAGATVRIDGSEEIGMASGAGTIEDDWEDNAALRDGDTEEVEKYKDVGLGGEEVEFKSSAEGIEGWSETLDVASDSFDNVAEEPESDVDWLRLGVFTSQNLLPACTGSSESHLEATVAISCRPCASK
ncbi:MAG: hypothetical protein Q9187_003765 [Circinaria calcarea]